MVTWGTSPQDVVTIDGKVPNPDQEIDLDKKNNKTITFIQDYKKIGYQTIKCSVKKNRNLDKICQIVKNKTAILVGQSGVGKSSIINKTTNNILKISEISAVSGQGKHTTANSMMFNLPNKGKLIDSPGIRDFITYAESFSEIISNSCLVSFVS